MSNGAKSPATHPATKKATITRLPFRAVHAETGASSASPPSSADTARPRMRRHSNHAAKTLPATDSAKIAKAAAPSVAREPTTAGSEPTSTPSRNNSAQIMKVMRRCTKARRQPTSRRPVTMPPMMTANIASIPVTPFSTRVSRSAARPRLRGWQPASRPPAPAYPRPSRRRSWPKPPSKPRLRRVSRAVPARRR